MAKSDLLKKVNTALSSLDATLQAVEGKVRDPHQAVSLMDYAKLGAEFKDLENAVGALSTHLNNLKNGEAKTLPDRLRKVANFFKNKTELEKARDDIRNHVKNLAPVIANLKTRTEKAQGYWLT